MEYVWQTGKAYACNDASNERLSTLSSFFINAKINKNPMVTLFSWIIKWLLLLMKIDAMFYLFIYLFYEQYWCYVIKVWHSTYNYYTVRKFDRENEERENIRKNDLVLETYIHSKSS